jgi:hypothetical protein
MGGDQVKDKGAWPLRLLWASLVALAAFTVLTGLVAPIAIKAIAERRLGSLLGRRVEIERLRINPFLMAATINRFEIFEDDARTPFVAVGRIHANLQGWSSLKHRAPIVKEIQIEAPRIRVVRMPGRSVGIDSFNFSPLLRRLQRASPPGGKPGAKAEDDPPRFRVSNIQVVDGTIALEDHELKRRHNIKGIELRVPFVSTLPDDADQTAVPNLRATFDDSPVTMTGRAPLRAPPHGAAVEFSIGDFDLTQVVPYVPVPLPLVVAAASVDARLTIGFRDKLGPSLVVSGQAKLSKVILRRRGGGALLDARRVTAVLGQNDLLRRRFVIDEVHVAEAEVHARRRADGSLDISPLLALTKLKINKSGKSPPFRVHLGKITLDKGALKVAGEAPAVLADQRTTLRDLRLDSTSRTAELGRLDSKGGSASVLRTAAGLIDLPTLVKRPPPEDGGTVVAAPGAATGRPRWTFALKHLSLEGWRARAFDQKANPPTTLETSSFNLVARQLSTAPNTTANITVNATLVPRGRVHAVGTVTPKPLAARLNLNWDGIEVAPLQPYGKKWVEVLVTGGTTSGRAHLDVFPPTGTKIGLRLQGDIDVAGLVARQVSTKAPLFDCRSLRVGGLAFTTTPKIALVIRDLTMRDFAAEILREGDGRLNLEEVIRPALTKLALQSLPSSAVSVRSKAPKRPPPTVSWRVDTTSLVGGRVHVLDRKIRPPYEMELKDLQVGLRDLSSRAKTPIAINASGRIDHTGRFTANGRLNPLANDRFLDIVVKVDGFDLPPTSPYAGKFVGHTIKSGSASLALDYKIQARKLDSKNKIVLYQFSLGDKVDSPTATKLPVPLGVSLLKDRHGVIDIQVPIKGSLDDPDFRFLRAVEGTFVKLITKVIAAPFAFIGRAFDGGEDLAHIEFAPGQAQLDGAARDKITKIGKAMHEHPGVLLDVVGHAGRLSDIEALRQRHPDQIPAKDEAAQERALRSLAEARARVVRDALVARMPELHQRLSLVAPQIDNVRDVSARQTELRVHK